MITIQVQLTGHVLEVLVYHHLLVKPLVGNVGVKLQLMRQHGLIDTHMQVLVPVRIQVVVLDVKIIVEVVTNQPQLAKLMVNIVGVRILEEHLVLKI